MLGFIITALAMAINPGVGFAILAGWIIIGDIGERIAHERAVDAKYQKIAARLDDE